MGCVLLTSSDPIEFVSKPRARATKDPVPDDWEAEDDAAELGRGQVSATKKLWEDAYVRISLLCPPIHLTERFAPFSLDDHQGLSRTATASRPLFQLRRVGTDNSIRRPVKHASDDPQACDTRRRTFRTRTHRTHQVRARAGSVLSSR